MSEHADNAVTPTAEHADHSGDVDVDVDVAVIGLGLAGLRAAGLLAAAGRDVRGFDASARIGGRVLTVRGADGRAILEGGAEWIDGDHARMIDLVDRTGLHRISGGAAPLQRLAEAEAEAEAAAIEAASLALARVGARPPERPVIDYLRDAARHPAAAALLAARYRSDQGEELSRVGLGGWLHSLRHYAGRVADEASCYRVAEGITTLCERLAAAIAAPLELERRLCGLTQDDEGVTLRFVERAPVRARRVVLAVDLVALRRLALPLPEPQARAFDGLGCGRSCKVMLRFTTPFWRESGWGRSVLVDSVLAEFWDASLGDVPTLCAYVVGDAADQICDDPDAVAFTLRELSRFFPEAPAAFVGGELHPWVGRARPGPHAYIPPGYDLSLLPWRQQPWGRVHFAGEHTADRLGFMEGALESAERVVAQILAASDADARR